MQTPPAKKQSLSNAGVALQGDLFRDALNEGEAPTFETMKRAGAASNWPLETWAADLLLTCQVGQQFDASREDRVRYFLERRSGPIGAALAVSITLPEA